MIPIEKIKYMTVTIADKNGYIPIVKRTNDPEKFKKVLRLIEDW